MKEKAEDYVPGILPGNENRAKKEEKTGMPKRMPNKDKVS